MISYPSPPASGQPVLDPVLDVSVLQDAIGRSAGEASGKTVRFRNRLVRLSRPLIIPAGTKDLTLDLTGTTLYADPVVGHRSMVTSVTPGAQTLQMDADAKRIGRQIQARWWNGSAHEYFDLQSQTVGDHASRILRVAPATPMPASWQVGQEVLVYQRETSLMLGIGAVPHDAQVQSIGFAPGGGTLPTASPYVGTLMTSAEPLYGAPVATAGPMSVDDLSLPVTVPPGWYWMIGHTQGDRFIGNTGRRIEYRACAVRVLSDGRSLDPIAPVARPFPNGARLYRMEEMAVQRLRVIGGTFDDAPGNDPTRAKCWSGVSMSTVVDSRFEGVTFKGGSYNNVRMTAVGNITFQGCTFGPVDTPRFGGTEWTAAYGANAEGGSWLTYKNCTFNFLKLVLGGNALARMLVEDCVSTPTDGALAPNWGSTMEAGHGTGSYGSVFRRCVAERFHVGHDAQLGGEEATLVEDCTFTRWINLHGGGTDITIRGKHPDWPFTARFFLHNTSVTMNQGAGAFGGGSIGYRGQTTTTGTGPVTVTTHPAPWDAAWPDGSTHYLIVAPNGEFEAGTGTMAAGVLTRTLVRASSNVVDNVPQRVNFGAGTKTVFPRCAFPWGPAGAGSVTLENAIFGCLIGDWHPMGAYTTETDGKAPPADQRMANVTATNCTFDTAVITGHPPLTWNSAWSTIHLESTNRSSTLLTLTNCTVNGAGTLPPITVPAPSLSGKPGSAATQGSWAVTLANCAIGGTTSSAHAITATGPGSVNAAGCTYKGETLTAGHIAGSGMAVSVSQ